MNWIDDSENDVLSVEELAEVREYAGKPIRAWRGRTIYSGIALILSCAFVYPFLYGHALHGYWESFGKYLIFVSMALLVVFLLCAGSFYAAWKALRDVERG